MDSFQVSAAAAAVVLLVAVRRALRGRKPKAKAPELPPQLPAFRKSVHQPAPKRPFVAPPLDALIKKSPVTPKAPNPMPGAMIDTRRPDYDLHLIRTKNRLMNEGVPPWMMSTGTFHADFLSTSRVETAYDSESKAARDRRAQDVRDFLEKGIRKPSGF